MSCKKVCIGDLRHNIDIIDKSMSGNSCNFGYDTEIKASVKAKIETLDTIGANGRLIFDDTNLGNAVSHKITIRFRNDIEGDDIVKYDNRYFTVKGFKDIDERKRFMIIYVVERGDTTNNRNLF